MDFDALTLSRLQFVWVIAFHILLPAFTVGLASFIAFAEGVHFFSRKAIWSRISAFWISIFSVAFGMGVVSGIVMPFQFGTNWSRFSFATSNILTPLLAYEGLTAFFLEATFLGVLLFGRKLVPRWVHFFATLMVAFGTLFSSFWILSANSWMQTPRGFLLKNGQFFPKDWMAIIFNPSFPYRLCHTVCGFYITTGFVVLAVGATLILGRRFVAEGRLILSTTLWFLLVLIPLQIILGDMQGLNTRAYQPAKLAAIEAIWDTRSTVPLTLFAVPDQAAARNRFAISVPFLGSLILTHSLHGTIQGLKNWPANERPPVGPPFFAFRIMVGLGLIMLVVVVAGNIMRRGARVFETRWFLRLCQAMAPVGFIAILAGWVTTEVGRQPWTVYGLMRTADSVTPSLTARDVAISLIGYMLAYLVIYPAGFIIMARIIRRGPGAIGAESPVESGRPISPVKGLGSGPQVALPEIGA